MSGPLIYLVAGEASGDALGAGLMQALREQRSDIRFAGIGGEAMQSNGLNSLFPYRELSLMGFMEVVPHIPALLRRIKQTVADIADKQPAAIVTIDSPGFNFRLAAALKKNPRTRTIPRIHYVAPSVWAYKPGRARKTAQLFNALLTLLPFEPPYFEKEGLVTTFVGHPVLWENQRGDADAFRKRHAIAPDAPVLLILPGSRAGEIKQHLALFVEASRKLPSHVPVILASPQVKELIIHAIPSTITVADIAEKKDAFASASLALSKSGTITLELAAAGVPMVVAHKANPVSAWLVRRMILIQYASLVNIAANKQIIPELIQERCTLPHITEMLLRYAQPDIAAQQKQAYAGALQLMRGDNTENPNAIAAQTVLRFLQG